MGAAQIVPAMPAGPPQNQAKMGEFSERGLDLSRGTDRTQALVPAGGTVEETAESPFHPLVLRLPVEVDVSVPIRGLRVKHLLALAPGQVIESQWNHGIDLPLAACDVQLAWTEFEVMETKLAVRVTRVA